MTSVTGMERFLEAADYEARRRRGSSVSRAHRLQARDPRASPPWTVFDRNLVAEVLQERKCTVPAAELVRQRTTRTGQSA